MERFPNYLDFTSHLYLVRSPGTEDVMFGRWLKELSLLHLQANRLAAVAATFLFVLVLSSAWNHATAEKPDDAKVKIRCP